MATQAEAARRMQAVNAAWAVLGDRESRAAYDADLGLVPAGEGEVEPAPGLVRRDPLRTFVRRFAPLLVVLVLLATVLWVTAHAGPAPS